MYKTAFRLFALVVAACFLVPIISSATPIIASEDTNLSSAVTIEDVIAGLATPYDLFGDLDPAEVPEAVGLEVALERGHIQRLYEEEGDNLNQVVFLNSDGTRTQYTFSYPVKYYTDEGEIADITLTIEDSTSTSSAYQTAANSTMTTFSRSISDGISLSGNNVSVTLVPVLPDTMNASSRTLSIQSNTQASPTKINDKTVSYTYDEVTTIEYSLTYTGFKEDIVVEQYTGQTEYDFRLLTNGLFLQEIDGSFYLVDATGVIRGTLGDIIVFTADERNNTLGELEAVTIENGQEYLLTIVLDAEYLADENTVYPIRIDPTVEITYDNNGAGAIEDVTINSTLGSAGSSGSIFVGWKTAGSYSRILMRFPGLNLSNLGNNVEITSATVQLRDLMCEADALTMNCHVFTGNSWTEGTVNWSNANPNSYSALPISSNVISYSNGIAQSASHRYSFDITEAVRGWLYGNYDQNKGIIFKAPDSVENGSTYLYKTFASYNRASNKPSLSVSYTTGNSQAISDGTYYINNQGTGKYLRYTTSAATGASGYLTALGSSIRWQIQKVSGGYVLRSANDATKYLGVHASPSTATIEVVTVSNSSIPSRCLWDITIPGSGACMIRSLHNGAYLASSGTYLSCSSGTVTTGSSAYYARIWRFVGAASYSDASSTTYREMTSGTNISNLELPKSGSSTVVINPVYPNELWVSPDDFAYEFENAGVASYASGSIFDTVPNALMLGGTKVAATHKPTGRVVNFYVIVAFSSTISETPKADNIATELSEPYDVWPASIESRYYTYSTTDRVDALINIQQLAMATVVGGWAAGNPKAAAMLNHFLNNSGTVYTVDMNGLDEEGSVQKGFLDTHLNGLIQIAEATATYSSKNVKTIKAISCNLDASTDWGRSVGSFSVRISATFRKTSNSSYTMTVVYELNDVYNWDRTKTSMGNLPVSPADMWELHHGGIAKNFEVYGIATYTVNWTSGQTIGNGAEVTK